MRAAAPTSSAQASHWTIRRAARPAGTAPPPAPPMLGTTGQPHHLRRGLHGTRRSDGRHPAHRRPPTRPGTRTQCPPRSSSPHPDPCQSRPPHRQARLPGNAAHAPAQYRLLSAHRSATAPPGRRADLADLRRPSTLGHAELSVPIVRILMRCLECSLVATRADCRSDAYGLPGFFVAITALPRPGIRRCNWRSAPC